MVTWHGCIAAVTGDRTLLTGVTVLAEGVDAARVRVRTAAGWQWGLATAAGDGQIAIIADGVGYGTVGASVTADIDVHGGQLRPPTRLSRTLFGVDPTTLPVDERRWLRHAILFALEAHDPSVRAERLGLLTIGSVDD